ncbi:MAG: asparaginase [Candidatus Zixiibacteriota bacterium]
MEPLAYTTRGNGVESVHYGSIAVTDNQGRLLHYAGDPEWNTFTRSSAKLIQAIPVFESGAVDKFGFTISGQAIMCGSHNGSPRHAAQTKENLDKIGIDESYLKCGVHPPSEYKVKDILPRSDEVFSPLQHNCSGKHSGQIALAIQMGCDPARYLEFDYDVQQRVFEAVCQVYEMNPGDVKIGTDGCSLPNFGMPLKNMAIAFANIITGRTSVTGREKVFERIVTAIQTDPFMVSGDKRFDLALMQALPGKIICKVGGEAVECVGIAEKGWGLAAKVSDGNVRALYPVVVEALRKLEILPDDRLQHVDDFVRTKLYNYRDIHYGDVVPSFELKKG